MSTNTFEFTDTTIGADSFEFTDWECVWTDWVQALVSVLLIRVSELQQKYQAQPLEQKYLAEPYE